MMLNNRSTQQMWCVIQNSQMCLRSKRKIELKPREKESKVPTIQIQEHVSYYLIMYIYMVHVFDESPWIGVSDSLHIINIVETERKSWLPFQILFILPRLRLLIPHKSTWASRKQRGCECVYANFRVETSHQCWRIEWKELVEFFRDWFGVL